MHLQVFQSSREEKTMNTVQIDALIHLNVQKHKI